MKLFTLKCLSWIGKWMLAAMPLVGVANLAQAADGTLPHFALTPVSALSPGLRPQNVPLDYLITPNGYFAAPCIQTLREGEKVHLDGSIEAPDGTIRKPAVCTHPHYTREGMRIEANAKPLAASRVQQSSSGYSGDVVAAYYQASTPVGTLSASWTVPPIPSDTSGQVLYFWPGLVQSTDESVLQPVLGFNAFNESSWTLASWNCCINGTTYNSSPINVNPGDLINGIITATCTSTKKTSSCATVTSTDATTDQSTSLTTTPDGKLTEVWGAFLEVYTLSSCSQLPTPGQTIFANIQLEDMSGNAITPSWEADNGSSSSLPACGYNTSWAGSGITLTY